MNTNEPIYKTDFLDLFHCDNMELMAQYPDKYFDLAIVDPPYGININVSMGRRKGDKKSDYHKFAGEDKSIPSKEYYLELFRISKNQIIWGGNYMTEHLKPSKCWLIWDKMQEFTGSDFEMAWTSFDKASKAFRMTRIEAYSNNNKNEKDTGIKIHPTQKPVKLYEWLLHHYAKPTDKILDTHLGSGSSRIAAYKGGYDFTGYEIDHDYYNDGNKRFNQFKSQTTIQFT